MYLKFYRHIGFCFTYSRCILSFTDEMNHHQVWSFAVQTGDKEEVFLLWSACADCVDGSKSIVLRAIQPLFAEKCSFICVGRSKRASCNKNMFFSFSFSLYPLFRIYVFCFEHSKVPVRYKSINDVLYN